MADPAKACTFCAPQREILVYPILAERFKPDGFNVGANYGEAAGQSVWHAHIHVIPLKGNYPPA
jgi:diadenosine tetraphosphate (Ap4A) HIT family hydrolase